MNLMSVTTFFLLFNLFGIASKRLGWIHWFNSRMNMIPEKRRVKIDWDGYSNFMANLLSIVGFFFILGWIIFSSLGVFEYFPLVLITFAAFVLVWGQMGYAFRRFDHQEFTDMEMSKMKIKILEYYHLDLIFYTLTILLILLNFSI